MLKTKRKHVFEINTSELRADPAELERFTGGTGPSDLMSR